MFDKNRQDILVMLDMIVHCPLVSMSFLEKYKRMRVLQCTHMLKLQQHAWGGLALWTMSLYLGCTSELLWRTPYSPSCSPPTRKSSLPIL